MKIYDYDVPPPAWFLAGQVLKSQFFFSTFRARRNLFFDGTLQAVEIKKISAPYTVIASRTVRLDTFSYILYIVLSIRE